MLLSCDWAGSRGSLRRPYLVGDLLGEASWERARVSPSSGIGTRSWLRHAPRGASAGLPRHRGNPNEWKASSSTALEVPGVGPLDKTYRALAVQLLALIRGEG